MLENHRKFKNSSNLLLLFVKITKFLEFSKKITIVFSNSGLCFDCQSLKFEAQLFLFGNILFLQHCLSLFLCIFYAIPNQSNFLKHIFARNFLGYPRIFLNVLEFSSISYDFLEFPKIFYNFSLVTLDILV